MGLPCGEFEDGYSIDFHLSHKDENYEYWDGLIGSDMYVAVVESETEMFGWRKWRLCLKIIVNSVFVACVQRNKCTHVRYTHTVHAYGSYVWAGRLVPNNHLCMYDR